MSLADKVRKAVVSENLTQLQEVMDFLRMRGFNYADTADLFQRVAGVGRERFEEMCQEIDSMYF